MTYYTLLGLGFLEPKDNLLNDFLLNKTPPTSQCFVLVQACGLKVEQMLWNNYTAETICVYLFYATWPDKQEISKQGKTNTGKLRVHCMFCVLHCIGKYGSHGQLNRKSV